jgi:hypothetical protein
MRLFLAIGLLFLAACPPTTRGYGAGAGSGGPPPLPPGWDVPQFDHYCAFVDSGDRVKALTVLLDAASREGWELVAVSDGDFCFKRPLDLDPASPSLSPPATPPSATAPGATPGP